MNDTFSLILLALGTICELSALSLPQKRYFSLGLVFWSALLWHAPSQAALPLLGATLAISLRQLCRPRTEFCQRWVRELTATLLPLGAAWLIWRYSPSSWTDELRQLLSFGALSFTYLPLQQIALADLTAEATYRPLPQQMAMVLALPAWGWLLSQPQLWPSSALPALACLFLALASSASLARKFLEGCDSARLQRHLEVTKYKLNTELASHSETHRRLRQADDNQRLRQQIISLCQDSPDLPALKQIIFSLCHTIFKSDTIIIFAMHKRVLEPLAWQGAQSELLEMWTLLGARDRLVEDAWNKKHSLFSSASSEELLDIPSPLAERECSPLRNRYKSAVMWGDDGILYLGSETELSDFQRDLAVFLGQESFSNWKRLAKIAEQDTHLRQLSDSHRALQDWAKCLEDTLRALPQLSRLDSAHIFSEELSSTVQELLPAEQVTLLSASELQEGWLELWETLRSSQLPLLLGDILNSRLHTPHETMHSLLAVPVLDGGEMVALLVAESSLPYAFSRADQNALTILALQIATVWSNHQLHERLHTILQELQESQSTLVQNSKMAAIGQLAAGVAHELNTPLGATLLGIDSALGSASQGNIPKLEARLESAKSALFKAKDIVAKLLYYSREAGQTLSEVDLNSLIQDTLQFIGHHLRQAQINLKQHLSELPLCSANQNEIQQILTNLILNARDALNELPSSEERQLTLSSGYDSSRNRVWVRVSDNGPGIAEETLSHIFEPFFTTKAPGQGTGLGLPISRQIAIKHKGNLLVKSQPGSTNFTLELPS